jgi:hypothetical protein
MKIFLLKLNQTYLFLRLNPTTLKNNNNKLNQNSIRYCGNCKGEYKFDKFIQNYSKTHRVLITNLWQNPMIRFVCPYCYLLEIIKSINKKKRVKK